LKKVPFAPKRYNVHHVYGSKVILFAIVSITALATVFFFLIGFFSLINVITLNITGLNSFDFFVFGVLTAIGPIGYYNYFHEKKKRQIEDQLPDFLREISGSTASGMTVYDAITATAQGDHGKLTPELKRLTSQLTWGISVREALENFAQRVNTDRVKRMVITINKALEIGGNNASVFEAAAKEIDQAKRVEMQRKAEMSMYSIVIFISFFVFLAVILVIDKTIFSAIMDLQGEMAGQAIGNMQIAPIDHNMLRYTFFSFLMVQSIGGGMLGGFMMDGNLSSGIRFGFILVLISFIVFKFFF